MLALLLRYWSQLASATAAALAVGSLFWTLWAADIAQLEAVTARRIQVVHETVRSEMIRVQTEAQEVSHGYQTDLANLQRRLATLRLRGQERCVPVTGGSPSRPAGSQPDIGLPHTDGISFGSLIEFAGDCEADRQKLAACQKFIAKSPQ